MGENDDDPRSDDQVAGDGNDEGPCQDWTPEQRRAFRGQLERRRARQLLASQLVGATLIVIVAAGVLLRLSPALWIPAVGAVAVLGTVYRLANWKCPNCGERLRSRRPATVCLGCGAPLE